MRWLAVIATSTYILTSYPYVLSAADLASQKEPEMAQDGAIGVATTFRYRAEERRDPFEALVKAVPDLGDLTPDDDPNRPRGPLEKFDISTLKLVGIVWGGLGPRGVVRAPDNKGYFVTVGTYLGENGGRVVDVAQDRLVIEEKYKDLEGNKIGKTLDLSLRRKEKEE